MSPRPFVFGPLLAAALLAFEPTANAATFAGTLSVRADGPLSVALVTSTDGLERVEQEPPAEEPPPDEPPPDEPPPVEEPPPAAEEPPPAAEEPPAEEPAPEPPAPPAYAWEGWSLYVEPDTMAAEQAEIWRDEDPEGARLMDVLAAQPVALWVGDWFDDVTGTVDEALDDAGDQLHVLVAYNIPDRDCGNWSEGGADGATAYEGFIDDFAAGIQGRDVIVILEPDALGVIDCLDDDALEERFELLSYGVDVLTAAGASVYLDAGDSNWIPAEEMAASLLASGVENAAGFAINVSHTEYTANEIGYANEIRAIVGDQAHYVIDTSRNGTGPNEAYEWCNPIGVAAGELPSLDTGVEGLDAYLWIKPLGESDGECNGGPEAGHWWPEYAADVLEAGGY